jgi:type I restriction enzyme S subunit
MTGDPREALQLEQFEVPRGWSWRWLDEIMDIRGGAQPPAITFLDHPAPGYVRFVQIRDFDGDSHLTYIEDSTKWRKCSSKDVLIARYGASLGRILRGLEGAYNVALAKAIPKGVDLDFLYYLLKSQFFQEPLAGLGARSVQSGFNKEDLRTIPVPVPPLPEQNAIAHILGTLEDKIELNRQMNETLEAMARALFKSWFVDFDPVRARAEGRQPFGMDAETAALFPDSFQDSPLGKIPTGWRAGKLHEMIELQGGGTPKTSVPEYWNGTIPWFSVVDAPRFSDVFVVDTEKKITEAGLASSSTTLLPTGTTVISARGTVGKLALLGRPMAMNQSCYGVRPRDGYGDYFTYFCLRDKVDELSQSTHGTVFDTVTRDTFKVVDAVIPPEIVTRKFDEAVSPFLGRILSNLLECRALADLRDTLLPKLISGEVRVPLSQRPAEVTAL